MNTSVLGQRSISLIRFDDSKTYFQGGSISVHFKPIGVYPFNQTVTANSTNFRLQLIKAADSSIVNDNIGSERNFFVPVLNGTIPASIANGSYKIKVIADSAGVEISNVMTNSFLIQSGTNIPYSAIELPSEVLQINCYSNNNYFGFVNKSNSGSNPDVTPAIQFNFKNYDASCSYTTTFIDHSTASSTNLPLIPNGSQALFEIPAGKPLNYYTIEIIKTKNGISTSYSYIFLFNTGNTSLGNTSSETVCVGTNVNFTIDLQVIEKNYPGSYYTVNFGDGSTVKTYTHAEFLNNLNFSHSYTTPTCQASALLNVGGKFKIETLLYNKGVVNCNNYDKNGNGTTKYVNASTPPIADFSGPSPICINSAATFLNNSTQGYYGTGSTCIRKATYKWATKRPSSSTFINQTSYVNSTNDLVLPINFFDEIGIWQIRLTAQNDSGCNSISTVIKDICVQPIPVANFKFNDNGLKDSIVACAPKDVIIDNSTPSVSCSPTTFTWTVMYESTRNIISPNTGIFTYINGTNGSSQNPNFNFTTPGRYLLKLSANNTCKTDTLVRKIIIAGNTGASLPPDIAYCGLRTISFDTSSAHRPTYSSTSGNGEMVNWSITPSSYSFVGGTNANSFYPQIQFNDYVNYTVQLTFNSNCPGGQVTKTQIIRFDQALTVNVATDKSPTVCRTDASFAINASVSGPSNSIAWTASGNGTYSPTNSLTTTYTFGSNDKSLSAPGLLLILTATPNAPNVCPAKKDTIKVAFTAVNTLTSASTKTICSGVNVAYTPTATLSGSTFNWTSTVTTGTATGNTASGSGNISDILVNGSATVDAVVTYTITPVKDGCNGNAVSFTVTVKPQPNISSTSSSNPSSCGGTNGSITLNGLIANISFSVSYKKNGGSFVTVNATSNASGVLVIPNLGAGVYSDISVTSANNCSSNIVGPITLSDPSAPAVPTAGSNSPICSGTGNSLNLTANSSTSGVTYTWSGPNTYSSTQQNPTITNVTTAASGTYNVTATLNGCTSAAGTVIVNISATPVAPIVTTPVTYCVNETANPLVATALPGNTLKWYDAPTGGNMTTSTPTPSTTTAGTTTYYVSQINTVSSCESVRSSIVVTVKPTPVIGSTSSTNPTSCNSSTGTIVLNGLTANTSYTVNYTKNGSAATATITSNGSGVLTITGLSAGTYTNISVTLTGCASNVIAGPISLTDPNPPATPTAGSNGPLCSGTTLNLTASSITSGVTYSWSGPNSFTNTSQNPNITNITTAGAGTYSVTASLAGCTSSAGTVAVVINQTPVQPTATSNSPICSGSTLTLNASSTTSGVSYAWSGSNSFTSAVQSPSIINATAAASGTYSVTATLGSCTSTAGTASVTVKPTPAIGTATSTNPTSCNSSTGTIILDGLTANTSYTVNYTKNGSAGTATITSNGSGVLTITGLSAGTYTNISVTLTGCASNIIAGPISLTDPNPPAVPVMGTITPVCSGGTLNLSASSTTSGVTYNWSGPNSFTSNSQNPAIANVTVAANGTYSVTATLSGCVSAAATGSATVYQTPATPVASSNSPVCTGTTLTLTSNTSSSGVSYTWSGPNSFTSGSKDTSILNITSSGAGAYSVVATSSVGSCVSAAGTTTVFVNPTPVISGNSFTNPTNCNTATGSITLSGLTAGSTYTVNLSKNGTPQTAVSVTANASGQVIIPNLTSGTYSNITVAINNCVSSVLAGPISLTDPNPPATPVVTTNAPICSGTTLTLNANSTTSGVAYAWSGPNSFTSSSVNPTISNVTTAATGTYSVTATLNGCVSTAGTASVVINATPAAPVVGSNSPLCYGSTINLTSATSFGGTLTYSWTGPNSFTSNVQNPVITNANENASGTYILTITANTGSCSPAPVNTSVTVRPLLTQAQIAGLDTVFVCGFAPPANASQTLTANLNAGRPFETGLWTVLSKPTGSVTSFGNAAQASTTFTYDKSGLYGLQWAITNDVSCPSTKDTVYFSVVDKPAITQNLSASGTSICAGNPVTIQVPSTAINGQIKYWQFKRPYTAAVWQDTLVTNPSITFSNLQDTIQVRLVVIATDQVHCSGDTAFKEIRINVAPPSLPGTTAGDNTVCKGSNSGTITLTGNIGSPVWQSSTDGINFTNLTATGQTYNYLNLTVTTWFRAAVNSGVCNTVYSNATKITVYPPVTQSVAGTTAELCGDTTYTLSGNAPSVLETGLWTFASGSPTATINNPSSPTSTLSNLVSNTNYQLVWTLSNGICPPSQSTVIIKNYLPLTNTIDTSTVTVCNSVTVNVTGNTPVGGNPPYIYQWQSLQGSTWTNITGATGSSYSFTATATIKLRRLVTALPCTTVSLEKTIYVQPPLSNNTISGNAQTCINTSPGILTGSLPSGADGSFIYQWQQLIGTTWTDITGAVSKDYTVPVLSATTKFRRLVTSALCSGNQGLFSPEFEVIVRPDAKATWVVIKDTACAPFNINNTIVRPVTLPLQNSSYNWYANNIFYGTSATANPGYTLNNPGDSVTIKMVAVSLYGCKNDSLQRKFFTIPPVLTAFTVSDTTGCGPLVVNFTNTTPNIGFFSYLWNFGNGQTSTAAQPGPRTFASNPNFGDTTYLVKLTATSECESVVKTKSITVKSKPKSIFTPNKSVGCSPLTVTFANLSKGIGVSYIWNFDDGTIVAASSNAAQTHTFNTGVQDTFDVKLIAINECGRDTAVYKIVVSPNQVHLDFAINGNQSQGCKPHAVSFINASSGATNFQWNFGDGNTLSTIKNIDTVTHTFLQSGTYIVTLYATNGCSDTTSTETIHVFNPPSANFTASPLTACIGDTVRFFNQTDTATSLLWNFRDGYTSTLINPPHAFATAGVYNVQLKAIRQYNSGLSCTDTINKAITIVAKLPGLFTVSDSISNCVPFTVTFTNNSLPSSLTVWTFAPGVTDTGNVVTHTFTQVGTYNVKMVAKHPAGCTYEATKNIVVRGPSGTFQYDHGIICGNTPVRFSATVQTTDSIRWDFGDGTFLTTNGTVVYHTYTQGGFYVPKVTLKSNNLATCSVVLQGIDTIKVDYVKTGFRYAEQKYCDSTNVQFTDTSRSYFTATSWKWSFGDGTFSTLRNPAHTYTSTNIWQVQLIVTSATGCSDTLVKQVYIKVNNKPVANINAAVTACTSRPISYQAQVFSADSVTVVSWSFSNGYNTTGLLVNNIYVNAGIYTATLVTGTLYGCQDTARKTITINPSPNIIASSDITICKGQSTQLNVTGTTSYNWSPLNGTLSCTTCTNPIANPLTTTQYVVMGTNSFGCTAFDTVVVTVAQPIDITASANDTICIGQSAQLNVTGATTYIWSPAATLSSATTATPVATPTLTTQYRVIGFDSYNCFQDTAYVVVAVGQYPTVNLGADKILPTGTPLPLTTVVTNGPITKWLWGPSAATLSCTTCPLPTATIKREVCYTVEATNLYKCTARDTMCVKVFCEGTQVFIPNAFTPDGDGVNDVLMVRAQGIRTVKNFRIFNRWGQVVFERNNFAPNDVAAGWDGTVVGKPASPDVYVYTCEVVCENDISYTYKGNVSIVK